MQFIEFYAVNHRTGATLPFAKVTVTATGTSTKPALFDVNGAPLGNPLTADLNGLVGIATADGLCDIQIVSADGSYSAPPIQKFQFADLTGIIGTITSGRLGYATWAQLATVTGTAGQLAEVPVTDTGTHTDPVVGGTVNNTGVFRYSTSPAGWQRIYDNEAAILGGDLAVVEAEVSALYSALTLTSSAAIGTAGTPATGTPLSDGVWVLNNPIGTCGPGSVVTALSVFALSSHTITIYAVNKSGTTFTVSGSGVTLSMSPGLNTFTGLTLPVASGQYLGFYAAAAVPYNAGTPSVYFGSGNVTSFTSGSPIASIDIQIKFTLSLVAVSSINSLTVERHGGVYSHQLNFIGNHGESLAEGSNGAVTTAQEFDNVGFPPYSTAPATLLPATVANLQVTAPSNRGEFPALGGMAAIKSLIANENGLSYTVNDYQLATCNNGLSGQRLDQVAKGTSLYTDLMAQVAALATVAAGRTSAFHGVFLNIGVNDDLQGTAKATYKAGLIQFAKDIRTDGKAATGQYNDPITFIAQTGAITSTAGRDISIAQLEAANESPLIVMPCPMYFLTYYSDSLHVHVDAAGSRWMGLYYGLAYKRVIVDRKPWNPLQPVRHEVIGNTVDLFFNNEDGLVFDTTTLPAQTNNGFTAVDGSGTAQTISSVSIISPNRVRVVLASTPAAGWEVRYGIQALTGNPNYVGGGGNLRDCAGDRLVLYSIPMHNWSVIFRYTL